MSKSLLQIKQLYSNKKPQMEQEPPTPVFSQESEEHKQAKKPSKTTRKQRVTQFVHKIHEDSIDLVLKDILDENVKLRKEIESLRVQNVSLKRDMDELTHALLQDRLKNQSNYTDFN